MPGQKRLSVGFDGTRRGTTLPNGTLGVFTFNPSAATRGVFDVRGALRQSGAGEALAITAGLSSVAPGPAGEAVNPTVASLRFSPVPAVFDAHALIDQSVQKGEVDASTDRSTHVDAIVLTNSATSDRFTQVKIDTLPTSVRATIVRRPDGSAATLDYLAVSVIERVFVADFEYAGPQLDRAVQVAAQAVPPSFTAAFATTPESRTTINYTGSSRLVGMDAAFYDRAQSVVVRGALTGVPTALSVLADLALRYVDFHGSQPLGSAVVQLSRNLGAFAPLDGDHATFVASGPGLGVSARVTGLKAVDAFLDGHPRVTATFDPGGQAFVAAGQIDDHQKARVDVSNLPPSFSLDLDPSARTVAWRADAVVARVRAAVVDTANGPSVVSAVNDLPRTVDIAYELGERPHVTYQASSVVPRIEFFASPRGIETLDPDADDYLSATATEVPTEVDLLVDFPVRHLEATMSASLGGVAVVARFPIAGRAFVAAAELTGVPGRFDADFTDGLFRFRALSGPLSSAHVVITNHAGTVEPTGLHAAVHFRESTGDVDASVRIRNLTTVEYARPAGATTFVLEADVGGDPVVVDADVVLASGGVDDTRLAAVGRVTGLPTTLRVDVGADGLTYGADRSVGLSLEVRLGKVSALQGLGAPLLDEGVAIHARGCANGPGCANDSSLFCTIFGPCLGAVGTIDIAALPSLVVVDPAAGTVRLAGYRPEAGSLRAYIRLDGLLPQIPQLQALAALGGLPSPLDITLGPFSFDTDDVTKLDVGYQASSGIGSLQVDAELDTTTSFGDVRGRVRADGLPATLHVTGQFGSQSHVTVDDSGPVGRLFAQVTALLTGNPASGLADLSEIPAEIDLDVRGFGGEAVGVPTITYDGHGASTLDGLVQVEADLVRAFSFGGIDIPLAGDAWARIANLGSATTVRVNPDTSVNLSSTPGTDRLEMGGSVDSSVPDIPIDIPSLFDGNGFSGSLKGHVGAPVIHIGGLALRLEGLRTLAIQPGQAASYLTTGLSGDYERLVIDVADVLLQPAVDLTLHIDTPSPLPDVDIPVVIDQQFTGLRFHLSDQQMRPSGCVTIDTPAGVGHIDISTIPGPIATDVNHIEVLGNKGRQSLNYIDPVPPLFGRPTVIELPLGVEAIINPDLVSVAIDLVTAFLTQPFGGGDASVDGGLGGC